MTDIVVRVANGGVPVTLHMESSDAGQTFFNKTRVDVDGNAVSAANNVGLPVTVLNFPAVQEVAFGAAQPVDVANFPAVQAVLDGNSAAFQGVSALVPQNGMIAPAAAGRSFGVFCTAAGNVELQFPDGSTLEVPVFVGWQTFPFAVVAVLAGGTTAQGSFYNLK